VRDEVMPYLHWRHAATVAATPTKASERLAAFTLEELENEVARRKAAADGTAAAHARESEAQLGKLGRTCPLPRDGERAKRSRRDGAATKRRRTKSEL
jgi:hypothetical protein